MSLEISSERFAEVYNDLNLYPVLTDVALELGVAYQTVKNIASLQRKKRRDDETVPALIDRKSRPSLVEVEQAELGELGTEAVLPGYAIRSISTQRDGSGEVEREWVKQARAPIEREVIPKGHVVKGLSTLTDEHGRTIAQWVKTREGVGVHDAIETIKTAFTDYPKRARLSYSPPAGYKDHLTLYPLADLHLGLYVWGAETNGQNWDLGIAEKTIGAAIDQVVERSPRSEQAIVLGGGDLLHADNSENRTAKSGNALDVDGRYQKVLMAGSRLIVRAVDAALRRHTKVTVRILPGNHDEHASVAVAYFMLAWYRNDPRVTVDVDPSLFFWFRFGKVLLGATHGHTVKIKDMAGIMAHRRAADWGLTRYRYIHGFHLHHTAKFTTEGCGVISEIHQSPAPQDAWHFGSGFLSGRSMQSITYHQQYGEISRARVAILDDCDGQMAQAA